MPDPAILEAAAQVLSAEFVHAPTRLAKTILAAITPLIRAAALEQAAQVALEAGSDYDSCNEIADAIRSLIAASPSPSDASA